MIYYHHSEFGIIHTYDLDVERIRTVVDNIFDISSLEKGYDTRQPKFVIPKYVAMLIAFESGKHPNIIADDFSCDRTTVLYALSSIERDIKKKKKIEEKYLYARKILGLYDKRKFTKTTPSIKHRVDIKKRAA